MTDPSDPLVVEYVEPVDGLTVVRQSPPASAGSFSATYIGPAGHAYDPQHREGLALLTSNLVGSGAGPLGRVAFAQALDRLGATFSTSLDPESVELTVWGPESAREKALDLWALAVTRPRFSQEDIARVRRQVLERQLREISQPDSRCERELHRAVFPRGHPYRETGLGTADSVRRISAEDLQRFHREHFTREGGAVIVTSRASSTQLRRALRRRLEPLGKQAAPPRPEIPKPIPLGEPTRRVVMRGRAQVEIRMGGLSIPRDDPEYTAAYLANEVLGGRPLMSRLFQNVREEHGLAYGCSSDLEALRWGGMWQVHAGTGPDREKAVVPLLESEVRRIRDDLIPRDELDGIRESALGEIPLQTETTTGAHSLAVEVAWYGLPADFYRTWPKHLKELEPASVRSAAQRAFDTRYTATVIAGSNTD
ncbi:MAG: pitrilysin family protein [Thermoplasmata archaeon]